MEKFEVVSVCIGDEYSSIAVLNGDKEMQYVVDKVDNLPNLIGLFVTIKNNSDGSFLIKPVK